MFRTKFNSNNFYVTSDLHFDHINICRGTSKWNSGYRDFNNHKEMNETLINNINKVVPPDGHLFVLGDIKFGDKKQLSNLLGEIKCVNIYYLYGNHCMFIRQDDYYRKLFKWCGDYLEIFVDKQLVCMFHYGCRVWNESHRGSWMLYGHSHSSLPDNLNVKSIDIGIDSEYSLFNNQLVMTTNYNLQPIEDENGIVSKIDMSLYNGWNKREIIHNRFTPFSYHEIDEIMCYKKQTIIDHHGTRPNME